MKITSLFQAAALLSLLIATLVIGFSSPAYAFGCEETCWDEWGSCMQDAEDWWGQCYEVCEGLYYPHDPMSQAECQNDCDIERENDEDVCDSARTECLLFCQT